MIDRRKERRRRCFLGGELEFEYGRAPLDCLIRNVGESGALIAIDEATALPTEFELYVAGGAGSAGRQSGRARRDTGWTSGPVAPTIISFADARRLRTPDA